MCGKSMKTGNSSSVEIGPPYNHGNFISAPTKAQSVIFLY